MAVTHDLTIRDVDSDSVDVLVRVSMIIDNLTKDQDVDLLDKFPDDLLFIVEMWVGRMEMAEAAGGRVMTVDITTEYEAEEIAAEEDLFIRALSDPIIPLMGLILANASKATALIVKAWLGDAKEA